jgi:hypothetical protein
LFFFFYYFFNIISTITLTNRINIGNDTDFRCQMSDPLLVKPNSFVQVQSAYIKKATSAVDPNGVYITIPEFSTAQTYWSNQEGNSCRNGMIACINSFDGSGPTADDIVNFSVNTPKISLNNSQMVINSLTLQLRDRTNAVIDKDIIDIVSVTIQLTDNPALLS